MGAGRAGFLCFCLFKKVIMPIFFISLHLNAVMSTAGGKREDNKVG
jgi:hypothetical protein